jgi:hypothetical protein
MGNRSMTRYMVTFISPVRKRKDSVISKHFIWMNLYVTQALQELSQCNNGKDREYIGYKKEDIFMRLSSQLR